MYKEKFNKRLKILAGIAFISSTIAAVIYSLIQIRWGVHFGSAGAEIYIIEDFDVTDDIFQTIVSAFSVLIGISIWGFFIGFVTGVIIRNKKSTTDGGIAGAIIGYFNVMFFRFFFIFDINPFLIGVVIGAPIIGALLEKMIVTQTSPHNQSQINRFENKSQEQKKYWWGRLKMREYQQKI